MKIAILILAHKNAEQLTRLARHLEKDFDVFIHIDKKSPIIIRGSEKIKIFKKYNIYWGSYNQILATLFLFKTALAGKYDHYILISGQDLPIKSNEYVINFFKSNRNMEYLEFNELPVRFWPNGGIDRLENFWINSYKGVTGIKKHVFIFLDKISIMSQKYVPLKRKLNYKFFGGTNWMDLTHTCVQQIISYIEEDKKYLKRFKYTRCADEIFFQTIIVNSNLETLLSNRLLRYIDWSAGSSSPKTLKTEDFDAIMSSDALFARKFDETVDCTIIDKIYNNLTNS